MNRINIFRKGDTVRVTTWRGCVLSNNGYTQHPQLRYKIATVYASNDREVSITLENGQSYTMDIKCVEIVKPKRRSFRQIIRSLAYNKLIRERYHVDFKNLKDNAEFCYTIDDWHTCEPIEAVGFAIDNDGNVAIYAATPEELLAIARASLEIAALRKEEA